MKKIMNKINFAVIAIMTAMPAFAENDTAFCEMIRKLQGVFKLLRTFAFVGAGFFIASWAWGYISKAGEKDGQFSVEDVKKKGTGLLVGFILFFIIGLVLQFLVAAATQGNSASPFSFNCPDIYDGWN